MSFYAYVHAVPKTTDAQGIFHVGKGSKDRAWHFRNRRNEDHQQVINRFGEDRILVGILECSNERTAFELEKGLIKRLRVMGVNLTNETGGGLGACAPSLKLQAKLKPNWRAFRKRAVRFNKERDWTPEMRAKEAAATSKFMAGMGWITDGVIERRFANTDPVPAGWRRGRLAYSQKTIAKVKASSLLLRKRWITNGINNAVIFGDEVPPRGWRYGRTFR